MPNPYALTISGVNSGENLLTLPSVSAPTTPYVELGSLVLTQSSDGGGGSVAFTVIESKVPSAGPWWRSGAVHDNAMIRLYDDRLAKSQVILPAVSNAARTGTTATITTNIAHNLYTGQALTLALASGPTGYTALNGTWTITSITATTFTFTTGTSGTITSGAATGTITIAPAIFLGYLTDISAELIGGLGSRAAVSGDDVDGWLDKTVVRSGRQSTNTGQSVGDWSIGDSTQTDREAINKIIKRISEQVTDTTTLQLLDTSVISGTTRAIYTGTARTVGRIDLKAGTLRQALEQVSQLSAGIAQAAYRFWVDTTGRINYGPVSAAPLYADAPFEIVTDPASVDKTGTGGTATSKILASNLSVALDHSDIVKGIFVRAANTQIAYDKYGTPASNDSYFRTYDGATATLAGLALAARSGPLPHEVIAADKISGKVDHSADVTALARASMQQRAKPLRTVSLTIAGADPAQSTTPDHAYGYTQGYKYDGSTYTLVKAWQAGQYIKITAPSLDMGRSIAVSNLTRSTTTATITTSSAHGLTTGDAVTIALTSGPTGYAEVNGTYTVASTPSTTTFTVTTTASRTHTIAAAAGTVTVQTILRIATMALRFEPGAYIARIDIEAEFRRQRLRGLRFIRAGE
jgi:hypothetical protein